ncbi:ATP-dependent helicase [Candidatus Saccharibacteria bacterium]|nr:ATP-dependent helicase [Candidatus Saccharibacteria bacterium]
MKLNSKQKEAVEYLEGPLLVLAGPGTGKTQLLSQKVAYILKNTDTNPENILCLTFTETGAKNMRERLTSIIGSEAQKVTISTYHSFGSEILLQYKNYSPDYDRAINAAIDEVLQFKLIKSFQDSLPARDILRKDNVKDIINVISEAKSANLSAKDLETIAKQNIEDSKVLSETISPFLKNIVPRVFKESYENAYRPIYELLKTYAELPPILKSIERSIATLTRDLKSAITEAESVQKIRPLSEWKDTYFEKDASGNYRLKDRVANLKLLSIAQIMEQYDSFLLDNGLFDFDDMILESVRILKNDKGFRATLSERYQFILLDEFQDTNPAQFSIIKKLTDYENPMIMAVGDDDQAIYEFQGALSTNLLDFQKHYQSNVIALVDNYRSTQEILDFSHEIIAKAPDRFSDKELVSHSPDPASSQIFRYEFLSSDMEYAFVAKKIHELIKNHVPQDEIAVISYKTKYFMPLLPYLKSYPEIKIAYEKRDNLFEDEKIHQILTIARFVYELGAERNENTSIVEILSYPFFNLPMLEVIKCVSNARKDKRGVFDYLSASENSEIKEVAKFLADLVAKSFDEPLELFLDYLIGALELNGYRSPFLKYYVEKGEYDSFSLYESLATLKGKLSKYYGDRKLRLVDLINMIDDYLLADMPLNSTSPYKEADSAVQILSAHKAKGLEFKYVFMISVDHMAWGKGKGNNNLLALPKNLIQIRHTGMTDGERLRILYVALTRAKSGLILTNSLHDFNDKSPDRLEYLEEYVDGENVISPFLPSKKVQTHYQVEGQTEPIQNLQNWLTPFTNYSPDMKALYLEKIKNFRLSASALTSFIDIVYAGPQNFFKANILGAPREPETEAMAFGNLVHATFEAVTKQGLDDEQAIKFFLDELNNKDYPLDLKRKLAEKGPVDLSISLQRFGDMIRQGKAEVDFAPDRISVADVPLTGKIDHLLINEADKTIEVFDYKTGGYHKEKWQAHTTLYKYMLQLGFYKLLINNSREYSKYHVKKAHILFVSPDNNDEVYDKEYEYSEKDEAELIDLIKATYYQISTLNFLKDKDIFVEPDASLGIKDIKKFIELLLAKSDKK